MGGDDSQKLLPWRGIHSSPGRKPPAQLRTNTLTQTRHSDLPRRLARVDGAIVPSPPPPGLSYRPPGSFLESTGGSFLARAEDGISTSRLRHMCALTITFADHKNNAFVELGGAAGKTGKEQLEQWKSIPPLRRSPEVTRLCFLRMAPLGHYRLFASGHIQG